MTFRDWWAVGLAWGGLDSALLDGDISSVRNGLADQIRFCRYAYAWRQFGVQAAGVNMEEVRARLVGRFGPEAEGWLAEVPNLAARLAARWGFVLGELFASGASSVVWRCQWADGTPAVLKLSPDRVCQTSGVTGVVGVTGGLPTGGR
ncbi:hypothetical protein GCM10012280_62880 [Wenjunlia tyrosinilytica]|uniref:Uncharacterized protein n=1 Tax=Wenjunlia tyrosinilytica TaxID=1544741 RepID=A0A918E1R2_9ACTN|nr:hypothetical protein GCM10012280_62880 [Wenjunlia tyrosinilytica]